MDTASDADLCSTTETVNSTQVSVADCNLGSMGAGEWGAQAHRVQPNGQEAPSARDVRLDADWSLAVLLRLVASIPVITSARDSVLLQPLHERVPVRLAKFLRGHIRRLRPWRHLRNGHARKALMRRRAFGDPAAKGQSASSRACFRWGHDRFESDPERAWHRSRSSPAPTRHL